MGARHAGNVRRSHGEGCGRKGTSTGGGSKPGGDEARLLWYYTDRPPLSLGERVFFATYQSWLQAFFMALLFFVAAYFTPASYDRKRAARYVRDRFVRLIVPTLLYMFVIGPVTEYYISRAALSPPGQSVPSPLAVFAFILAMAIGTFVVRIFTPSGTSIVYIHPGDLPQYALMFAAGILAGRGRWLEHALPNAMLVIGAGVLAAAAPLRCIGSRYPARGRPYF